MSLFNFFTDKADWFARIKC